MQGLPGPDDCKHIDYNVVYEKARSLAKEKGCKSARDPDIWALALAMHQQGGRRTSSVGRVRVSFASHLERDEEAKEVQEDKVCFFHLFFFFPFLLVLFADGMVYLCCFCAS